MTHFWKCLFLKTRFWKFTLFGNTIIYRTKTLKFLWKWAGSKRWLNVLWVNIRKLCPPLLWYLVPIWKFYNVNIQNYPQLEKYPKFNPRMPDREKNPPTMFILLSLNFIILFLKNCTPSDFLGLKIQFWKFNN